MSEKDRIRWDAAYADRASDAEPALPRAFIGQIEHFPMTGSVLDIACGAGTGSVWLARRGLQVWGIDVSAAAVARARQLAVDHGVAERCRFDIADLDQGLPDGPSVDVVLCHRFRDRSLYAELSARLRPGGLLAVCVLSEVGAAAGRFRARAGELQAAFADLEVLAAHEGDGEAWLVARAPIAPTPAISAR